MKKKINSDIRKKIFVLHSIIHEFIEFDEKRLSYQNVEDENSYLEGILEQLFAEFNRKPKEFKFQKVYCSQCGSEFGPRDSGYSHCKDHRNDRRI
jgi:hypothetical protein